MGLEVAPPLPQRQMGAVRKMTSADIVTVGQTITGGSQDIRTFLTAAVTPKRKGTSPSGGANKRIMEGDKEMEEGEMEEGEMEDEGGELEAERYLEMTGGKAYFDQTKLMDVLKEHGPAGLEYYCQRTLTSTTAEVLKAHTSDMSSKFKTMMKQEWASEAELDKCRRSLVIQYPERWMEQERETVGYNMAHRVTAAIHKATYGMVAVADAFVIGGNREGPPPAVHITFSSAGQKGCFYSVLASMNRKGGREAEKARLITCRDSFPKDKLGEVRKLNSRAMELKRKGGISSFRIKAQGPACIPVLEVRDKSHKGPGGWRVHLERASEEDGMDVGGQRSYEPEQHTAGDWSMKAKEAQRRIEELQKEQQHANEQQRRTEREAAVANEAAREAARRRLAAGGGHNAPMLSSQTEFSVGNSIVVTR
jgi:hypothetical protein